MTIPLRAKRTRLRLKQCRRGWAGYKNYFRGLGGRADYQGPASGGWFEGAGRWQKPIGTVICCEATLWKFISNGKSRIANECQIVAMNFAGAVFNQTIPVEPGWASGMQLRRDVHLTRV